jgi:hypothetical protein
VNPISGLLGLFESAKGNVFMLATGVLYLSREGMPPWLFGTLVTVLGCVFMTTRSWTDAALIRSGGVRAAATAKAS